MTIDHRPYEQAAEGAGERVEGFGKKTEAEPTLAHFALSALVSISKKYLRIFKITPSQMDV